jgi:hypothetical protein
MPMNCYNRYENPKNIPKTCNIYGFLVLNFINCNTTKLALARILALTSPCTSLKKKRTKREDCSTDLWDLYPQVTRSNGRLASHVGAGITTTSPLQRIAGAKRDPPTDGSLRCTRRTKRSTAARILTWVYDQDESTVDPVHGAA